MCACVLTDCYLVFHPDKHGSSKTHSGRPGEADEPWLPVGLVSNRAEATPFFLVRGTMHDDSAAHKPELGRVAHAHDVVSLGDATRVATRIGGKTWWLGERMGVPCPAESLRSAERSACSL
jgi:hypothetical protein